jgi:spermidine synthase
MQAFRKLSVLAAVLGVFGTPAAAAEPAPDCDASNLIAGATPLSAEDLHGAPALMTDGALAPEGAQWDAPAAVTFEGGATITFDLGRARTIGAVFLQADANDTYKVVGSSDGSPGSYHLIAEVDNMVATGHGLRKRAVEFPAVTVRYLGIKPGTGDGRYSISEFAAYCRPPSPFPPEFRTVDAPIAEPAPKVDESAEAKRSPSANFSSVLVVALLVLAVGGFGFAKKRSGRRLLDDRLRLVFLASGCAALVYEVVWFHLLRLVIGASALSVGIVLASFMGGMFLGSLLFARFVGSERHPLRVYAQLEIGIGVFGLAMPLLLPAVRYAYVGLFGYGALGIVMRALIAAILLLPPTALMGATLPAIARLYAKGQRATSGLASLYSANTIGAVIGSLLSAFLLLAVWDVWAATLAAAALNFVAGGYAWRLGATTPNEPVAPSTGAAPPATRTVAVRAAHVGAALSGMTALGAQVVWTRLLTLLFGATVYAFAIILAVFLAGLGIGSAAAAYWLRRGGNALRSFAWSQLALVPALLLGAFLLATVLPYASPSAATPVRALHAMHVLRAFDVVFPAAVLWGMSFPFALAAGRGHGDAAHSTGSIYAANTVGAIVGALGVSFVAIPMWGTQWAEQAMVVAAAISAAVLFDGVRRDPTKSTKTDTFPVVASVGIGVLAGALLPGLPQAFLAHGRYIWWVDPADRYPYVSEGAASTVAVHIAPNGTRNFHVSGRVEASNNPKDMRLQRLLGHLSALAHPEPEAALVVGLGAGVTAGALTLHPEVKRIVICEIEPRVVGAAEQFAPENYGVLTNPKVELVFDDARHFLATTSEKFDVITSDPIHPWVRGNSILFSREYYGIVKSHLRPGGIATQWVPLYETTELAIQIQMRTFTDTFPDGTMWNSAGGNTGYDVVLLGSAEPLRLDVGSIQRRIEANPRMADSLRQVKINSALDLLGTYGTSGRDMQPWLGDTPVNRDFSLKLEYISGLALNDKEADPIYAHMTARRSFPDGLFVAPPEIERELRRRILASTPKP